MLTAFDARDEWLRTAERIRLHSLSMLVLARVFAVLLAASMVRVVQEQAGALARVGAARRRRGGLARAAPGRAVWLLWFRHQVIATRAGLEVAKGKQRRLIRWSQVVDIRELPWLRQNPPWQPRMWQVDLLGGESVDFIGVRNAREIVASFIQDEK